MPGYHMIMGTIEAYQNLTTNIVGPMGLHMKYRVDPAMLNSVGTYLIVSTREHDLSKMEVWRTEAHPSMLALGAMYLRQDSN